MTYTEGKNYRKKQGKQEENKAEPSFVGCLESNKWVSEQIKLALLRNANIFWDGVALNQSKPSAALDQVLLAKLVASSSLIDQRRLVAIHWKHTNTFLIACPRRVTSLTLSSGLPHSVGLVSH